jgi:hypothetical protein
MQHEGEVFAGIVRDLLQCVQYLLRTQLHDLAAQVEDPHHLFVLLQHCLREMQQTLVEVPHKLVVREGFEKVLGFDVTDTVHYYRLFALVASADAVLVCGFEGVDFVGTEAVLGRGGGT